MTGSNNARDQSSSGPTADVAGHRPLAERILIAFRRVWRPIPPDPPIIDPNLPNLPALHRISESLRYSILDIERSISPNGGLRAWAQLNVLMALVLGIPALLIIPVITYILSGFATWSEYIKQIAINLLVVAVAVLLGLLVLILIGRVVEAEFRRRRRR
jgi:hypothetical protein